MSQGIGIGVAGAINMSEGTITQSPNFPGWNNVPIKKIVDTTLPLHLPIFVENDANAAALGERWKGAGSGSDNMVCITLGTGIGGGVIANGILLHGAEGMASELGHITVIPNGPACNCGNSGCLEALCSATALRRAAIQALRSGQESLLVQLCGENRERITGEMIAQGARAGDVLSRKIYQEMGTNLGIGIASLINIFNPEKVIIGGQVSKAWDLFISPAKQQITSRALRAPGQRAEILPAKRGDDAGLLGAAYLVFSSKGKVV